MSKEEIWNNFVQIFTKTLFPAIITILIGIAVEVRTKKKLIWARVLSSFVIGTGTAYLAHEWIHKTYPEDGEATLAVSMVTMASYKGWELLMIGLNNTTLSGFIEILKKFLK